MKIDVTQTLVGYDGEPLKAKGDDKATLRYVCCQALTASFPDEQPLSGDEKFKRYMLAQDIFRNDTVDLTVEQVAQIKELIAKGYDVGVVGPAWLALDPPAPPSD